MKKTAIDRAIEKIDGEIATLQMVKTRLRESMSASKAARPSRAKSNRQPGLPTEDNGTGTGS